MGITVPDATQQKGGNPSRYAAFDIGNGLIVTVRASAHNADAGNYAKDGNVHGDSNLSIVLQKRNRRNTFKPNDEVKLEEYVYVDSRIASVENPLSQIALSLVNYLTDGNYVDTTGVAIPHKSPITESKTNKNMKKNVIKLNENALRQIVAESVKKVLKEINGTEMGELQDAEEKYEEAKQHKDLDVALDLLIDAYNILESYYERIRNISMKTGSEAVSDKEYADFSRLYCAVYGSLQGIAESGFPEFTTEDLPFPLDGFEDLMY